MIDFAVAFWAIILATIVWPYWAVYFATLGYLNAKERYLRNFKPED